MYLHIRTWIEGTSELYLVTRIARFSFELLFDNECFFSSVFFSVRYIYTRT